MFPLVFYPPPPLLRLNIAYFAVAEGWLLLDIGWFVLFLFYCTSDQVRVSSICVNFCRSYAPFGTENTRNPQLLALFSYMLSDIELKFCIWFCFTVLQIKFECRQFPSIFVWVMPLLECRILKIHSFPHFSLTPIDLLSWSFAFKFVLLYYRPSSSVVNLRQFL